MEHQDWEQYIVHCKSSERDKNGKLKKNKHKDNTKDNILKLNSINDVDLKLVWDPPWTKDKMSEAAKLELNL